MKKTCLYLTLSWLIAAGCSKVDSTDLNAGVPYYQHYDVTFDKTNSATMATAYFLVRDAMGARVELKGDDKLDINGAKAGNMVSTIYSRPLSGMTDVNYVLTKNGTTLTNNVRKTDIADISFQTGLPSSFNKSAGLSFSWAGDLPTEGESVSISVEGRKILDTFSTVLVGKKVTGHDISFASAELAEMTTGPITLILTRTRSAALDVSDATAGGEKNITLVVAKEATLN